VTELAAWLQGSALGHAMRDTGVWTYAVVNLTHILAVGTLFGSLLILDLRLMGVWPRLPLLPLTDAIGPIAASAFVVAAMTGAGLLATKTTEYVGNPFLLIKFPAIALGLINVALVRGSAAWRARGKSELSPVESRRLAIGGGVSLACWTTAIAAGRMIGYW
jgi:hypothetical protein